jgi:hypothetical protein
MTEKLAVPEINLKDIAELVKAISWPLVAIYALLVLKKDLIEWFKGVTRAKVFGQEFERNAEGAKQIFEGAKRASNVTFGKGTAIPDSKWLDWNRIGAAVTDWAIKNRAENPYDMGPQNFKKALFDLGIPGGEDAVLEWDERDKLRYK